MKNLFDFQFSEFSVLAVLFIGILLSLLIRLMHRVIFIRIANSKIRQWYQIGELTIWMLYGTWALHKVLGDTLYYQLTILLILLVIFIWISWFVVRDFIAGLVLKLNDSFQLGQYFKVGDIEGTILAADYLQLNLRQENGVVVKIPYNKISGAIHARGDAKDQSMKYSFEVQVGDDFAEADVRSCIRRAILLTAGARINAEPRIIRRGIENKKQWYEVQVPVLNPVYNKLIEKNVVESLR